MDLRRRVRRNMDRRGSVVHDRWRRMECRGRRGRMELWRRVRWRRVECRGWRGRMELLCRIRCDVVHGRWRRVECRGRRGRMELLCRVRCDVVHDRRRWMERRRRRGTVELLCRVRWRRVECRGQRRTLDRPRRRRVSSARRHRLLECRPGRRMELRRRVRDGRRRRATATTIDQGRRERGAARSGETRFALDRRRGDLPWCGRRSQSRRSSERTHRPGGDRECRLRQGCAAAAGPGGPPPPLPRDRPRCRPAWHGASGRALRRACPATAAADSTGGRPPGSRPW